MLDKSRFAGHTLIEFSSVIKDALERVAKRLAPHEDEILNGWIARQWRVWQPPGFSRENLRSVFGGLLQSILNCMGQRELELCIDRLENAGADLAYSKFPFQALIVSIHFLEESYMPFLLNPPAPDSQKWLIAMDEFLHAALAAVAGAYFEAYREELLEQAEVGRIVQEGLLADIPKHTADLEIAHIYISAHEQAQLGGDFLDYFSIGKAGATFFIGDLSGHGLEAASDSVMLRSLFRGFMRENPDMADAMGRLNRVLDTELESGQFATALAVSYEASGKLSLVNAGHPPAVICGATCDLLELEGMALSVDRAANYSVSAVNLEPGGIFVAYTDGIIEARSGREMFGFERLVEAVTDARDTSARNIAEHLVDESLRHAGGKFLDDVAILVLKRRHKIKGRE